VVAEGEFAGDFATGGGEANVAVGLDANQAVLLQTAYGHGDGGRRDFQPIRESCRDDGFSFTLGLEDGFEIVFLGDSDHLGRLYLGVKHG